jgi:hypothetical protein
MLKSRKDRRRFETPVVAETEVTVTIRRPDPEPEPFNRADSFIEVPVEVQTIDFHTEHCVGKGGQQPNKKVVDALLCAFFRRIQFNSSETMFEVSNDDLKMVVFLQDWMRAQESLKLRFYNRNPKFGYRKVFKHKDDDGNDVHTHIYCVQFQN